MGSLKVTYNSSDIINLASAAGTKTLTTNSKFMTSDVAINYDLSGGSEPEWILLCSKDGPASSTWGLNTLSTTFISARFRDILFSQGGPTFYNGCTASGNTGINVPTTLAPSDFNNGFKGGYSVQVKILCTTYRTDDNYTTNWNATLSQHIFRHINWRILKNGSLGTYSADMYMFDTTTEMSASNDGADWGYMYNYVGKGKGLNAYSSSTGPRINITSSTSPVYTSSSQSGRPKLFSFDANQYYTVDNGTKFTMANDWVKDPSIKFELYMRYIKDGAAEEFKANMQSIYPGFDFF